jgi:tetratricopeptide (TPR) repeat protein
MTQISRSTQIYLCLILFSIILAFSQAAIFKGSLGAILLTILLQLLLPGWLLIRALKLHHEPNIIARGMWALTAGLGLTITTGGIFRFLEAPIPAYLLALHGLMLIFLFISRDSVKIKVNEISSPVAHQPQRPRFHQIFSSKMLLYALLALCCFIAFFFGYERSQLRYDGWEDQTVFVSLADWLANNPDDPGLLSRQTAVENVDYRWLTDGWTYNHAAWVWSSGVPAATLIWHWLTPLFAWTVPLAVFALGYQLSHRENFAVYCACGLLIGGLMTVDSLVYNPTSNAYGQNAFVQLNTLRLFSSALMLPLAQMAFAGYLNNAEDETVRSQKAGKFIIAVLAAVALAFLHPRQIAILTMTVGAYAGLRWLAQPSRQQARQSVLVLAVVIAVLILPYLQRVLILNATSQAQYVLNQLDEVRVNTSRPLPGNLWLLGDFPLLGKTFILQPSAVFYHPLVALGTALALLLLLLRPKKPEVLFVGGSALAMLTAFFLPGAADLFMRIVSVRFASTFVMALPIALILGASVDWLGDQFSEIRGRLPANFGQYLILGVLTLGIIELAFEPLPIPASGRDQNQAMYELQALRNIKPADQALLDVLTTEENRPTRRTIYLAPNRIANFIVESVPQTLVMGGRDDGNDTGVEGTDRFYTASNPPAPFFDWQDAEYIDHFQISSVVLRADDTRLPQLILQPERFQLMAEVAGYLVFEIEQRPADSLDKLFHEMNLIYGETETLRWHEKQLDLSQPGSELWREFVSEWTQILRSNPGDNRALYALAMSYTLAGEDIQAIPLWEILHQEYPQIFLFTEAVAQTRLALGEKASALSLLSDALNGDTAVRVLAGRTLMSEAYFFDLDVPTRERIIEISRTDRVTWDHLIGQSSTLRANVSLLLSVGQWDAAEDWLGRLPEAERGSQDLLLAGTLALRNGEVERTLEILHPATNPDTFAAKAHRYPDYWQNNVAAQSYHLLMGELAAQNSDYKSAERHFQEAINWGSQWAGRYFLGQHWVSQGQIQEGERLLNQISDEWRATYQSDLPQFVSLLTLADGGQLYIMDAAIQQSEEMTVWASFGDFQPAGSPYRLREWNVEVVNPETYTQYARALHDAFTVDAALTRLPIKVEFSEDVSPGTRLLILIQSRQNNRIIFQSVWMEATRETD